MMSPDATLCLADPDHANDATTKLYFFKNEQFACWDVTSDRMLPGYPQNITEFWPGLLEAFPGVKLRGALHVPEWGNKIYFFFEGRSQLVVWDTKRKSIESELVDTRSLLHCPFPHGDFTPVSACVAGGQRVVYGFHNVDYVRWTVGPTLPIAPDAGYPRRIADDWKDGLMLSPRAGVYVDWPNRSAAHSNKKIYFFMGDLYLRWDVPSNTRNYRLDILAGWKGWPAFA